MKNCIDPEEGLFSGEFCLDNKKFNERKEEEEIGNEGEPEYFNMFDDESLNETA